MHSYLKEMNQKDFEDYLEYAIHNYAKANEIAGRWVQKESIEKSTSIFLRLLEDGVNTKDHYFYHVVSSSDHVIVGYLWLFIIKDNGVKRLFVSEITIDEAFQNQGYGTNSLLQSEKIAIARRIGIMELFSFSYNTKAHKFYEKLGYHSIDHQSGKIFRKEIFAHIN